MCRVSPGELKKVDGQCLHGKSAEHPRRMPRLDSVHQGGAARAGRSSSSRTACHSRCLSLMSADGKCAPHSGQAKARELPRSEPKQGRARGPSQPP